MTPYDIQRITRLLPKPSSGSASYELVCEKNNPLLKNRVFIATLTKERVYDIFVKCVSFFSNYSIVLNGSLTSKMCIIITPLEVFTKYNVPT